MSDRQTSMPDARECAAKQLSDLQRQLETARLPGVRQFLQTEMAKLETALREMRKEGD